MKKKLRTCLAIAAGLPLALLLASCAPRSVHQSQIASSSSVASQPAPQIHRDWIYPDDGVTFSNQLPDARLNDVQRLARDHYRVTIAPEIVPINPSPWYGFSVRSAQKRHLTIQFRYLHGKQRYTPKLSRDGRHWRTADKHEFSMDKSGYWTLQVDSTDHALQIYAQIPISDADYQRWQTDLADHVRLDETIIGQSVDGRPLRAFTFGNPDAHRLLVVIGRQHPPETTGARALMKFVDTLASEESHAQRFRQQVLTLVIPMLNPDGVAAGNWRGNADGQDLNRDWGPFREPETRAGRDAISKLLAQNDRSLALAVDFHSTWKDIFYIVKDDPATEPGGLLQQLILHMQQAFPEQIRVKANAAKSSVFKNWIFRHFHAPAVTYEVGDRSSASEADHHARYAAITLMKLLTRQSSTHATDH